MPYGFTDIETPVPLVDLDRLSVNLDRMAAYAALHQLALRPHVKTHKSARIAAEQMRLGAVGLTVATPRELQVMSEVTDDVFLAHPPLGAKIRRVLTFSMKFMPSLVMIAVGICFRCWSESRDWLAVTFNESAYLPLSGIRTLCSIGWPDRVTARRVLFCRLKEVRVWPMWHSIMSVPSKTRPS